MTPPRAARATDWMDKVERPVPISNMIRTDPCVIHIERKGAKLLVGYFLGLGPVDDVSGIQIDGVKVSDLSVPVTIHYGNEALADPRFNRSPDENWSGRVYIVVEFDETDTRHTTINPVGHLTFRFDPPVPPRRKGKR